MPTVHLLIKGKVQGVFYRASAKEFANETGVTGWVKNTPDGNVEAVATGSQDRLNAFVEWCKRGPQRANVEEVETTMINETAFKGFRVIRG